MKITWNPSEATIAKALRVSELKENRRTYKEIAEVVPYSVEYLVALKNLGDQLRHEAKNTGTTS